MKVWRCRNEPDQFNRRAKRKHVVMGLERTAYPKNRWLEGAYESGDGVTNRDEVELTGNEGGVSRFRPGGRSVKRRDLQKGGTSVILPNERAEGETGKCPPK